MYIRFFLFFDNTFMRRKNHKAAFTLAELLVTISIITILALGISNVNFARLSQNQQVSIEAIKISNLIEEARNNALIGKGIWENLYWVWNLSQSITINSLSWVIEID